MNLVKTGETYMDNFSLHEYSVINKYNQLNILGCIFMNDGYCYLDEDNYTTEKNDIPLKEKYKKWKYQVNLYRILLETAKIDFKKKNINILDIACGQGGGVSFYKDYYGFENVYGVDLNKNHIKICESHCENVNLINASATDLPIENKKIDIITCLEAISYFQPFEIYCEEAHRILKDDGMLIHASPSMQKFKNQLEKYFNIKIIKDINMNVSIACSITKHLHRNNKQLLNIYTNDENRYINNEGCYEIYVMSKKN